MRNEARRDLLKVWLYAMTSVLLAAALAPWLYNLGRALVEVTAGKQTNGMVEHVAAGCREAGLATYFKGAWVGVATVLLLPLVGWLKVGQGAANRTLPWALRLPGGGRLSDGGQRLKFKLAGGWDALRGAGLSLVLIAALGVALVKAGAFGWRGQPTGFGVAALRLVPAAVGLALVQEIVFRGFALGIFLRSMGAVAAISTAAALSALVGFWWPLAGSMVVDPETAGAGFELLRLLVKRLADPWIFTAGFLPLLAFGGLLGYARWRTAALWLPVGLHAGWLFANRLFLEFATPQNLPDPIARVLVGETLQYGMIPLVSLILAGIVLHFITPVDEDFDYGSD